ncbi:hypothetical protein GJ744_005918 [Endocarpon pusillum]|uniref:Uncharacterized protein n=1 Tax=Endocarpon pusillum TaxID=364733 RepID=A0A8H7AKI2_9EURO|nr:hypothetical protein GJ744_005918 [Endocarpon pusillum]
MVSSFGGFQCPPVQFPVVKQSNARTQTSAKKSGGFCEVEKESRAKDREDPSYQASFSKHTQPKMNENLARALWA